jgi:hypothetical protein
VIENRTKLVVAKEFMATRGTTEVLFPPGCEITKFNHDTPEAFTFWPAGAHDVYVVDRMIFESSVSHEADCREIISDDPKRNEKETCYAAPPGGVAGQRQTSQQSPDCGLKVDEVGR